MKKPLILFLSILVFFSVACDPAAMIARSAGGEVVVGSGVIIKEDRSLPAFDEVLLEGSMNVEISEGDSVKCTVEGDDNILPLLRTEVTSGRLRIYFKHGMSLASYSELNVYLEVPELKGAHVSGSGDIAFNNVTRETVKVTIDGSGDISGTGEVAAVAAEINGSGDIHLFKLFAEDASVEINGSGKVEISSSASLDVEINGSGDVIYKGNPSKIKREINGSGEISPSE